LVVRDDEKKRGTRLTELINLGKPFLFCEPHTMRLKEGVLK